MMVVATCPKGHRIIVGKMRTKVPIKRTTRTTRTMRRIHCVSCKKSYHRNDCKLEILHQHR